MNYTLPEGALDAYRRDGVVVLRGVYDRDIIERINADIARLFQMQAAQLGFQSGEIDPRRRLMAEARHLLDNDVKRFIATMRITQDLPSVHQLLTGTLTVDIARAVGIAFPVISTRASVHLIADELKIPGGYHKSPSHQDWRSIQGSLDNVVFWIPTTSVTKASNALEVVRGSHLNGLLPTKAHLQTPEVDHPSITEAAFEPIAVDPGDAIVFSAFLVHRTGDRGDGLVRIAASTRFNNAVEPTYVDRGYTTPYKYSYQLDLMIPDFPAVDNVRAVFMHAAR